MLDPQAWTFLSAAQRSPLGVEEPVAPAAAPGPGIASSPFSLPTHIRCRADGLNLFIEYRYVDGEEPMVEAGRSTAGVVVMVGKFTGRLRALSIPMILIEENGAQISLTREQRKRLLQERVTPHLREALAASLPPRGVRKPSELNSRVALMAASACLVP